MFSFDDICFYISHVESAPKARKINYNTIRTYLLQELDELESHSTLLRDMRDFESLRCEFPDLKFKHVVHPSLNFYGSYSLVDGDNVPFKDAPFPRWSGELGLLVSAYRGMKRFLGSDKQFLLWFEDDTNVKEDFKAPLSNLLNHVDFSFDFLSLGWFENQDGIYHQFNPLFEFGNDVFARCYMTHWAGAVLVSREGARKVVEVVETYGFEYPWDWLIFNVRSAATENYLFDTFCLKPLFYTPFTPNMELSPVSTIIETNHTFDGTEFSV